MELHECDALDTILFRVERTELLELKDKFKKKRAELAQQYIELEAKYEAFLKPDEIKMEYDYAERESSSSYVLRREIRECRELV